MDGDNVEKEGVKNSHIVHSIYWTYYRILLTREENQQMKTIPD